MPFSLYYVILRGWYALEDTRTAFWVTVVLNAVNLVIAVPLFNYVTTNSVGGVSGVAALAISYVLSYWITLGLAWVLLSRRLGGLQTGRTVRSLVRMLVAGVDRSGGVERWFLIGNARLGNPN